MPRFGGLVFVLALAGCFLLPADGAVDLVGVVTTEEGLSPDHCTLTLLTRDEEAVSERSIEGRFTADFVVSPSEQEYFAEIRCAGYAGYRSEPFIGPSDVSGPPLDLGTIQLQPN